MSDGDWVFGEFSISASERQLVKRGATVRLPPKVFDALLLFVKNNGSLVMRDQIAEALWPRVHVAETNLTNIIVTLRKLLGKDAIQTVSKFGYRFTLPVIGEPGVKQSAYASFVRAKELLAERGPDAINKARDELMLAVATDPEFAMGWAWLGRTTRMFGKLSGNLKTNSDALAEAAFQRAFSIDPDVACGHHFYTMFQVDTARAKSALIRLVERIKRRGEDPETLAGLVQVFRFCGLLDESAAAHDRAKKLDSTIGTSVAHTHFLQMDYGRIFETYPAKAYYLDAAAWASLGRQDRAIALLRTRLEEPALGEIVRGLMSSLLAILLDDHGQAENVMENTSIRGEPESMFYLGRHYGMIGNAEGSLRCVRRARESGFCSPFSLAKDTAFALVRGHPHFQMELDEAIKIETAIRVLLRDELCYSVEGAGLPQRTN